jgi:dynein heavy chain
MSSQVPDRQLIMENMLMAEGFVEAKNLAKKFASLYYLLEDLLSPQVGAEGWRKGV